MNTEMQKVLIVDDIDFTRDAACKMVRLSGYEAIEASTKNEAMYHYYDDAPDLVLMDIFMAQDQGFETIQEIREVDDDTPIIAIGAPCNPLLLDIAHELGAQSTLQKPFKKETLIEEIQKYI